MNNASILFLDVDGVLNNEAIFASRKHGPAPICPERCARLLGMVDDIGCRVVLSSSWRGIPSLERKLRAVGILHRAHKHWKTPHLFDAVKTGAEERLHCGYPGIPKLHATRSWMTRATSSPSKCRIWSRRASRPACWTSTWRGSPRSCRVRTDVAEAA